MSKVALSELKSQILSFDIKRSYIFYGNEIELRRIYVNKIKDVTRRELYVVDSAKTLKNELYAESLFGESNIFVVYNDFKFFDEKGLWNSILNSSSKHIVILVYTTDDIPSSLIDVSNAVNFTTQDKAIICAKIQHDSKLPKQFTSVLYDKCLGNLGLIQNEVDKLYYNYGNSAKVDFLNRDIFVDLRKENFFDLVNAITLRSPKAFNLWYKMREYEEPISLISVVSGLMHNVLALKGTNYDMWNTATGLTQAQINGCRSALYKWKSQEIIKFLKFLQAMERGIKLGEVDPNFVVDYIITMAMPEVKNGK